MPVKAWYPYAPDQELGVRFAADEERIDRCLDALAGGSADLPAGPVTTAIALDAAADMRRAHE